MPLIAWFLALLCLPVAAAPMDITISVPGPGAASYLPIELIPRIGADAAEGARVTVRFASGGGVVMDELLNNNADFGVLGLPAAMSTRLKDRRVVAIAAVDDLPLYVLLVRQGLKGKVKSVADLKGRILGVHSNSLTTKTNSHQLLELVLQQSGVTPDMVRVVPVGQRWKSEAAMLATGDADAIMGDEPHAARLLANKQAFALLHLGNPADAARIPGGAFLRGSLVARTDQLEQNPAKAELMVRILKRTLDWMAKASPEEIIAKAGIQDAEEKKHFLAVLKKFPRQYSRDGKFSTRQLKDTEIFFHASQRGNPQAQALKIESMIVDRWAGRKE
jgi:NitT/TauT family transport system substrate-binding protein